MDGLCFVSIEHAEQENQKFQEEKRKSFLVEGTLIPKVTLHLPSSFPTFSWPLQALELWPLSPLISS